MPMLLRVRLELEEIAGEEPKQITEDDIREAMDGAFETVLSESQSESIDDLEAAVLRVQFEVSRRMLARHLAQVAQKKLDEQRQAAGAGSSETRHPIELTVKLGDTSLRPTGSKTTPGR
jgi:hypothetical protein